MLPFVISKTKLVTIKKDTKLKKEKSFFVTGDYLPALKPKVRRKPLKLPPLNPPAPCDCNLMHLTRIVISYAPKSRKRGGSTIVLSRTSLGPTGQLKRIKLRTSQVPKKLMKKESQLSYNNEEFFRRLEVKSPVL